MGSVVIEGLAFGESPRRHEGRLWFVDLYDRAVWSVTGDYELCPPREMRLPNGSVVTSDGVLILAETFGARLTAFDVDSSTGVLSGRRVWAELPGRGPDGIAIDPEGAIWVADRRHRYRWLRPPGDTWFL